MCTTTIKVLLITTLIASVFNPQVQAQPVARLVADSKTQNLVIPALPGTYLLTDNYANCNDGLIMSQAGLLTSGGGQAIAVYKLFDVTNPITGVKPFPPNSDGSTSYRLGTIASATVTSDQSKRVHVYWGGSEQTTYTVSTQVVTYEFNADSSIVGEPQSRKVNSGRRVSGASAATCGAIGYTRDISVRAFGNDLGTDSAPASATDSSVIDWYYIGTNAFYSSLSASIPGYSNVTVRGSDTIPISAGSMCMFAGGISTSGATTNQVAVLNMPAGTGSMFWTTWNMNISRRLGAGSYLPKFNLVVIGGGLLSSGLFTDKVEVYDVSTKNVTTVVQTQLPSGGRVRLSATLVAERYVVFSGGYTQSGSVTNAVDVYDVVTKSWTIMANVLTQPRASMAVGALDHPSYTFRMNPYNFSLVLAAGDPGTGGPSIAVDQLTTFWQKKVGSLPQPRYDAGFSSWPSNPGNFAPQYQGKLVIAGGVTTSGVLKDDYLLINPLQDPTNPGNWTSIQFSAGATPQESAARTKMFVHIMPSTCSYCTDTAFWGGEIASGAPDIRYDLWVPGYNALNPVTDSFINHFVGQASATCFTGTLLNPNTVFAVRGFGFDTTSGTYSNLGVKLAVNGFNGFTWNGINPVSNKRSDLVGVGAGPFCLFAGGYDGTNLYSAINVFNASIVNPPNVNIFVGGVSETQPGIQLSVARRWLSAAFVPRPTISESSYFGGYTLFAGGQISGGGLTNVVDILDTRFNNWYMLSTLSLTSKRRSMTAIGVGSRYILFAGGIDEFGNASDIVDVFDADQMTISRVKSLSVARFNMATGVMLLNSAMQEYVVVFAGGATSSGTPVSTVDTYTFTAAGIMW